MTFVDAGFGVSPAWPMPNTTSVSTYTNRITIVSLCSLSARLYQCLPETSRATCYFFTVPGLG